ncbi:MAG: hypothetical protein GF383_01310 [Candidatus Lokiarchaeota archaeon]|nr:hypothetical protein [Candidatus Lokiarchaeota archaeon]MBD3337904.1 hypothetical protein [Candidatus Lokiarchaeota archaeon]
MDRIDPSFEIDGIGRVICKNHTKYLQFIDPDKDYFQDLYMEKKLTCLECGHYEIDNCYFSKSRIDTIEQQREKRKRYRCRTCGKKIDRMLSIIYKLFCKEFYDIEIPLICCECYEKIEAKEFKRYSKLKLDVFLLNIVACIYLLGLYFYFIVVLNLPLIVYLAILLPVSIALILLTLYIVYLSAKRIRYALKGLKYYKKYFQDQEKKKV